MTREERDRVNALTCGLIGDGAASRHVRLELARSALSSHRERMWTRDELEDGPEPFAAQLLVDHRGDVRAVLEDPALVDELARDIAGGDVSLEERLADESRGGPVGEEYGRLVEATIGRQDWRSWGGSGSRPTSAGFASWPQRSREAGRQVPR